jgi:general secretion pathway protein C
LCVDVAHNVWQLRPNGPLLGPGRFSDHRSGFDGIGSVKLALHTQSTIHALDLQQLANGHLFGAVPKPALTGADAGSAPDTRFPLLLTGIIAMEDPETGFAILGEQGKATHFYRVGAPLQVSGGGRLFRVFVDRVVLDFDGRLETLRLPRNPLAAATPQRARVATSSASDPASTPAVPAPATTVLANEVTPAQSTFSLLDAERRNVDGHMDGMVLHPSKRYQRQYGLRDGDTLTAVNGVTLTDPESLANALRATGKSLSLTFVRDGVQQTRTLQVSD